MMRGIFLSITPVAFLMLFAATVQNLGGRYRLSAEVQRKLVHIAVGLTALVLPFFLERASFTVFAVLALTALFVLRLPASQRMAGQAIHSVARNSLGDIFFLVSISGLFVLAPGDLLFYVLPLTVITVSDVCAALIGIRYGQRKFGGRDRQKSFEGTVVFFVVTWIITASILLLSPSVLRVNIIPLTTLVAAFAAYVEAESWRGVDNLFVPLGIAALLSFSPLNDPVMVALLAAAFAMVIIAARIIAVLSGLPRHFFCVSAVCLVLIAGLSGPAAALLALASFAAYIPLRNKTGNPEKADLDFIIVMALAGVFWFMAGSLTGLLTIKFYTISCAAVFTGFVCLWFVHLPVTFRFIIALATALPVWMLVQHLTAIDAINVWWLPHQYTAVISAAAIFATLAMTLFPRRVLRQPGYYLVSAATSICAGSFVISLYCLNPP